MDESEETKGARKKPGRKPAEVPTVQVALRLDPHVVEVLKDEAAGVPLATWITRILALHVAALEGDKARKGSGQ